jgi:anti-sigma B factor antagonist
VTSNVLIEASVVDEDILLVKLRGDLDAGTVTQFESEIQKYLDQGLSKIIIDCRYMGFVSSLGIGSLITLQTRLRKRGGEVKLAAIQGTAAQVVKLVRLDKVLDIYGDAEFARESFYQN